MSAPDVSVVVPTRDRAASLATLLDALVAQEGPSFEVIVVDDCSTDSTPRLLGEGRDGLDLRTVRLERPAGPGGARNAGWRKARARLVAFTDDDCVPRPGWLAALAQAHADDPGSIVQGLTEPDPARAGLQGAFTRSQLVTGLGPYFQTCNVAYPRDLLERTGGFDDAFAHTGEDADLAWRALGLGATATLAPGARVWHAVHDVGPLGLVRRSQAWADTVGLRKRHPAMRAAYRRGIFWKRSHEALLLALAGTALARRTRGASLSLWAAYAAAHRPVHGSWAGTLASLPAHLAVDSAEVLAMVRGSVRHRTLVL